MEKDSYLPPALSRSLKWLSRYSPLSQLRDLPLSLSRTRIYIYIYILFYSLIQILSLFLPLTHTCTHAHTHLSSVFVRIKSLACAKHARAHARHSSKSILYVSRLYEGTPSSFSTLTVTSFSPSPAPPAACCCYSVARWSPPSHVTKELKTEKL